MNPMRRERARELEVEQAGDELASAGRSGELERDRSAVRFYGDSESEESAALALRLHHADNRGEYLALGGKAHAQPVGCEFMMIGLSKEVLEKPLPPLSLIIRRQRASNRNVRHASPVNSHLNVAGPGEPATGSTSIPEVLSGLFEPGKVRSAVELRNARASITTREPAPPGSRYCRTPVGSTPRARAEFDRRDRSHAHGS
jgi:hypothetical protein